MKKMILISAITLSAAACGGKDPFNRESNPFQAYPGLENSVPPHEEKARNQFYVSDVFDIEAEEQQESRRILNFVEGQSATHKIRARVYMEGVGFNLVAKNLPAGASFTKSSEAGVWEISWKPAFGFIPANQRELQTDIQVELIPLIGSESKVASSLPNQIERNVSFSLMVRHTEEEPTIVSISGLEGDISESSQIPFKVQVADPASYSQTPPQISWSYDATQYSSENKTVSGQNGIDWDYSNLAPRRLNNGNWEYSLIYHTRVVAELHRSRADAGKIRAQFSLQAASSASELLSPTYVKPLNIILNSAQAEPGGTP